MLAEYEVTNVPRLERETLVVEVLVLEPPSATTESAHAPGVMTRAATIATKAEVNFFTIASCYRP
jgi:hypothetical protein